MKMLAATFMVILLINSICAYTDDSYQIPEYGDSVNLYPDDLADDNEYELRKRANNNYLRFGRSGNTYEEYEDFSDDFARPTRSGRIEKNDHFIRFGRSKQNYLRFGRDPHRVQRANHLRFGRSVSEKEDKERTKREVSYSDEYKRAGSNFLRFGRPNSNYMRFGRTNEVAHQAADYEGLRREASELSDKIKHLPNGQFSSILMEFFNNVRRNDIM